MRRPEHRIPGLLRGVADRALNWLPAVWHWLGQVPASRPEDGLLVSCRGAQHQRDRRSVLVELTPQGRAIFDKARADLLAAEAILLDGLSGQDRATLAAQLGKLAASLEDQVGAARG